MSGGSWGSLCLSLYLGLCECAWMIWSGIDLLCAFVYSRFQKAASYGALCRSVCVYVCVCTVYKGGERIETGWGYEVRIEGIREREGLQ